MQTASMVVAAILSLKFIRPLIFPLESKFGSWLRSLCGSKTNGRTGRTSTARNVIPRKLSFPDRFRIQESQKKMNI
jgi:hypothetical protein